MRDRIIAAIFLLILIAYILLIGNMGKYSFIFCR